MEPKRPAVDSETLHTPQLRELAARIDALLREHTRMKRERDDAGRRLREQTAELEELRKRVSELTKLRDVARRRIDSLIGDLTRIEERG